MGAAVQGWDEVSVPPFQTKGKLSFCMLMMPTLSVLSKPRVLVI